MVSWRRLGAMSLALAMAMACGYRFSAKGGNLPGGAKALRVPLFRNHTVEPAVEAWFTEALRTELSRAGREAGEAGDVVVEGVVNEVSEVPAIVLTSAQPDASVVRVSTYRIAARATLRVRRGEETLAEFSVAGNEEYLPGTEPGYALLDTEAARRIALRRLAEKLMHEAYERLTGF